MSSTDFEQLFLDHVKSYNDYAEEKGLPIYLRNAMRRLSDLMTAKKIPRYMTPEEQERFRADFFKDLLENLEPLVDKGFYRKKQQQHFMQKGVEKTKDIGSKNRKRVIDAWVEILEKRTMRNRESS